MKVVIALVILALAQATSLNNQWQQFKLKHGKTYKSLLEERRRFVIFQTNVRDIEQHNVKFAEGMVSYRMGINQFTDMTQEEFEATLRTVSLMPEDEPLKMFNKTGIVVDDNINWVTEGYVTSAKNQGRCGSSWAFSAVGVVEGVIAKSNGSLLSLSAQNMLDCVEDENEGCAGGYPNFALRYIQENGVLPDEDYPYLGHRGSCPGRGGQKIVDYFRVPSFDEDAMLEALSSAGPLSVGIDADHIKSYSGGIVDVSTGCTQRVNQYVLLVGSGSVNGTKYWLLKNSWGPNWGDNGYLKLLRGAQACGVSNRCFYATM